MGPKMQKKWVRKCKKNGSENGSGNANNGSGLIFFAFFLHFFCIFPRVLLVLAPRAQFPDSGPFFCISGPNWVRGAKTSKTLGKMQKKCKKMQKNAKKMQKKAKKCKKKWVRKCKNSFRTHFFAFSDPFFLHFRTHFFCIFGPIFFANFSQ